MKDNVQTTTMPLLTLGGDCTHLCDLETVGLETVKLKMFERCVMSLQMLVVFNSGLTKNNAL
jgi:hypothetical protein